MSKAVLITLAAGSFAIAMFSLANVLSMWFVTPFVVLVLWVCRDLYEQSLTKRRLRQYENRFRGE